MRLLLGFFVIFISFSAFSDAFDYETERLLSAKSGTEVLRVVNQSSKLKISRAACESQKKLGIVPTYCIQTTLLETKLGLIRQPMGQIALTSLSRHCVKQARVVISREQIQQALKFYELPKNCRRALTDRDVELSYIQTDRLDF